MKSLFIFLIILLCNQHTFAQEYTLPEASSSTLGGVKIGKGLETQWGVLSVSLGDGLIFGSYDKLAVNYDNLTTEKGLSLNRSGYNNRFILSLDESVIKSMVLNEYNLGKGLQIDADGRLALSNTTSSAVSNIPVGKGLVKDKAGVISINNSEIKGIMQEGIFLYTMSDIKNNVEFWIANNDGSGNKKIAITLPPDLKAVDGHLSPNGKILIFSVKSTFNVMHIYSCSTDGSNLKKIISGTSNKTIKVVGTY